MRRTLAALALRAALAGLALAVAAPLMDAPPAYADGLDRPKAKPKPPRKARPKAPAPKVYTPPPAAPTYYYVPEEPKGPEVVHLPMSFFGVGSPGGVGVGVSGGCCGGGGATAIAGGGADRYSGLAGIGAGGRH